MNPERRPLLMDAEMQGRSARPRPDLRSSPESALVDVKSDEEGNHFICLMHFKVIKNHIFASFQLQAVRHMDQKIH